MFRFGRPSSEVPDLGEINYFFKKTGKNKFIRRSGNLYWLRDVPSQDEFILQENEIGLIMNNAKTYTNELRAQYMKEALS